MNESEPYRELNRQHRLCYVKLPDLYMCKVDGAPSLDGTRRAVAAHVLKTGDNTATINLWDNGRKIGTMTMECGFNVAYKMAKAMCESLTRIREHSPPQPPQPPAPARCGDRHARRTPSRHGARQPALLHAVADCEGNGQGARGMKPKASPYRYISGVTESGKPSVVRGKAYPWKDGFVTFNAVDGGGEIIIHSRYVHARWFAAWRSAKRSAKRFRASARDGVVSSRTNGGKIKVCFTEHEADRDLASCGQKEACLSSTP